MRLTVETKKPSRYKFKIVIGDPEETDGSPPSFDVCIYSKKSKSAEYWIEGLQEGVKYKVQITQKDLDGNCVLPNDQEFEVVRDSKGILKGIRLDNWLGTTAEKCRTTTGKKTKKNQARGDKNPTFTLWVYSNDSLLGSLTFKVFGKRCLQNHLGESVTNKDEKPPLINLKSQNFFQFKMASDSPVPKSTRSSFDYYCGTENNEGMFQQQSVSVPAYSTAGNHYNRNHFSDSTAPDLDLGLENILGPGPVAQVPFLDAVNALLPRQDPNQPLRKRKRDEEEKREESRKTTKYSNGDESTQNELELTRPYYNLDKTEESLHHYHFMNNNHNHNNNHFKNNNNNHNHNNNNYFMNDYNNHNNSINNMNYSTNNQLNTNQYENNTYNNSNSNINSNYNDFSNLDNNFNSNNINGGLFRDYHTDPNNNNNAYNHNMISTYYDDKPEELSLDLSPQDNFSPNQTNDAYPFDYDIHSPATYQ